MNTLRRLGPHFIVIAAIVVGAYLMGMGALAVWPGIDR